MMTREEAIERLNDIVPMSGDSYTRQWDLDNEALRMGAEALRELDTIIKRVAEWEKEGIKLTPLNIPKDDEI